MDISQLRVDKIQCLSEEIWNKIHMQMECGLSWEEINKHGGINVSKLMAYTALNTSATVPWDIDIDRCIIIDDFEAPVTGCMKYIKPDYSYEIGQQTVMINHCDGAGMMLPSVSSNNFMIRGPWIKGLLSSFDYIKFCKVHGVEPKIKDIWGLEHDLIQENIQIVFTKSQMKMHKYYSSWQEYKDKFKSCGCHLCRTNFEEDWIADTTINYQMLQTLTDFTDDEIKQFTSNEHHKIESLITNKESMLRALKAEEDVDDPYKKALYIYPELLRETYSKQSIKDIKRRMLLDAKSGKIRCKNKRLYVIPDFYAACQFWFQGIKEPLGLLKDGEVVCKIYGKYDKADILRSPHLYMEHSLRTIVKDKKVYEWLHTNGIYTSCHDLISRVLQFDVDGDMLNVVVDPTIISVAERNIKEFNVIPLFYDATKADSEIVSKETILNGLQRAHEYSGIGKVSNALTKLWNRDNPDWDAAAWLCYYNNLVIDAAKTGKINGYNQYPEVNSRINKAIGGTKGRMPFFFQYSRNGRKYIQCPSSEHKKFAKQNNSTMNRICKQFDDIKSINMNIAGVPPFNWQMLMPPPPYITANQAIQTFCIMDDSSFGNKLEARQTDELNAKVHILGYDLLKDNIIHELNVLYGDYRQVYPAITKYLFTGENLDKPTHKAMYWRIFGDIAVQTLEANLQSYHVCSSCNQKIPNWVNQHICKKNMKGFFECVDCGKILERTAPRQCRCEECAAINKRLRSNLRVKTHRLKKKVVTK